MPQESPLTPFDYMREGPIRECEPRIILKVAVMVFLSICNAERVPNGAGFLFFWGGGGSLRRPLCYSKRSYTTCHVDVHRYCVPL